MFFGETSFPSSSAAPQFKADVDTQCWLAGESQAVEGNDADDSLLCDEIFGSCVGLDDPALNYGSFTSFARDDIPGVDGNVGCGVADLENLELDTAPDNLPVSFFPGLSTAKSFTTFDLMIISSSFSSLFAGFAVWLSRQYS